MRSSLDAWDTGFNHEMGLHQANLAHAYSPRPAPCTDKKLFCRGRSVTLTR
jgi:hypothetical protein